MQVSTGNWDPKTVVMRAHHGQVQSAARKRERRLQKERDLAAQAARLGVTEQEVVRRASLECDGFRERWRGKLASIDHGRPRHSWWG